MSSLKIIAQEGQTFISSKRKAIFKIIFYGLFFLLLLPLQSFCEEESSNGENKVNVDLIQPIYCNGVLSTDNGGVIKAENIRIQARHITYSKSQYEGLLISSVVAEGDLVIQFGDDLFTGDRIEYDFETKCGIIHKGKIMIEPWFFSGNTIFLLADNTYIIHDVLVTTSPNSLPNWKITSDIATITNNNELYAKNVKFSIYNLPLFFIPSFRVNIDSLIDSPISYNVKWGSRQGHRLGMAYKVFSTETLTAFLRLDYRLKRGVGGGFEMAYQSQDHNTTFNSISYVARDSSIIHPKQRFRYLFQGIGDSSLIDDTVTIHLNYDKISDIDMPTDYYDRGLELKTAGPTQLLIRRQEKFWIAHLNTRVRVNPFQTIKQELPTFETTFLPFNFRKTGVVVETGFKAAYIDLVYGNNQLYDKDYGSTRLEFSPNVYKNFRLGNFNLTPKAGIVSILYGNSPKSGEKYLLMGTFGLNLNTDFHRFFYNNKHVVTPYIQYNYFTSPTVSPDHHYIFDMNDGLYRLDQARFGFSQSFYRKLETGFISRLAFIDLYANAFFDTHTFPQTIPKAYIDTTFNVFSSLKHTLNSCWNFNQNELDYLNIRTEWTVNEDVALAAEYRHRSPYDFRKADHTNFILDSYKTVEEMRHSQLSDRRDTFLLHLFYRFHPCWALEIESRHGWNREFEPAYNEFEVDLIGNLPSAWNFKLSYQHREDDDRLSFYMSIGSNRPNFFQLQPPLPILNF